MNNSTHSEPRQLLICRRDQITIAGLGFVALLLLIAYTACWSTLLGMGVDIDRVTRLEVNFQVDLDRADWPELTLLPGIGPALAQRIVVSRRNDGRFVDIDALLRVKGIGPVRLARMRPYLVDWKRRTDQSSGIIEE
ncbi:MAG: helix-hairpin-helix domain-containing protein [Planctomycetota bacterium]|nr:helix-hairpin-helix domain-containing protein [Planctomycetota bacterium]